MARRLDFRRVGAVTRGQNVWSSTEVENLIVLVEVEKLNWQDCAAEIGRSAYACQQRYRLTGRQAAPSQVDCEVAKRERNSQRDHAIAARDARHAAVLARNEAAAQRGDLTFLSGDFPPPGYSALDKRSAGTC